MNKVIGFIGAGNMGQAMVGGIVNSKLVVPENIILSDLNEKALEAAKEKFGVGVTTDSNELAKEVDILVLSVKPNLYPIVIKGIKDSVKKDVIVVTIAAGKALEDTENMFGKRIKIVRVMPNTPALVGEGMAAICPNDLVSKEETEEVISIFESFGKAEIVGEKLMDAVTAVSGSSPAYVYMFIEAMSDAAVLGSAKMVLETGMHPGALKDMVCSPGGTTIEAVATLEKQGFRNAIIEAMRDCAIKSKEMSK
ncbi:pyrroline-5-carboxylate reductase [Clostridium sporogenes]|uniref:pyrroline-5-carboxylate reductase family protein n=1 Tax=Clostridium sporogenes TaxID=1509 RepID=UPI00313A9AF1